MKKYEEPLMDVKWFEKEDIIRTSGDENEGPNVPGQRTPGAWY